MKKAKVVHLNGKRWDNRADNIVYQKDVGKIILALRDKIANLTNELSTKKRELIDVGQSIMELKSPKTTEPIVGASDEVIEEGDFRLLSVFDL